MLPIARDGGTGGRGAAPQAAGVDPRRRGGGARRARRRALQRRPHRRVGDGGARGVRPAAGRRSAGAGDDHPDAPRGRRCCSIRARRSNAGRSISCSSRSWASAYARVALGCPIAARRAALGRRGREQGQRADARGAPAAQGGAGSTSSATSKGRDVYAGRRRRDRLRRLHRQRHAEDQRGAGRDGRDAAARRAVVDVRHAGRLPALAPGVPPLPQARRLLRVRRRAARRPQRPLHRRPRPLVAEGGAQRRRAWRRAFVGQRLLDNLAREVAQAQPTPRFTIHHDCVRLSRSGRPESRHGQGAGRRVPDLPRRRSPRPTRRSASR